MAAAEIAFYIRVMPRANSDLLGWFSEEERQECVHCGEKARVGLPDALATFCLACGAITVDDVRVDVGGRIPVGPVAG
jgi:hypothetical protein